MTQERWQRISHLYDAALGLGLDARSVFLDAECQGDAELRREIESLLNQQLDSVPALAVAAVSLARTSERSRVGLQLGGYQLQKLIGEGGMGEVYAAHDAALGRDVAIKILPAIFAADPGRQARFEREARLLGSLNHPHIAAIYGVVDGEGVRGLVLELVEGDTLAERLRRRSATDAGHRAPLPIAEAILIARQLADAIDAAHERGIVHRDLKPANVKITREGMVKVLDFGLAKAVAADGTSFESPIPAAPPGDKTNEGTILGTTAYMSPEQARGRSVDKRADIWAFGCILYEMFTGRLPFEGETATDIIAAVVGREPDWTALPVNTPPGVAILLRRCLDKNPKLRLRDIGDAVTDLEAGARESLSSSEQPAPLSRTRERLVWSLATVTVAALTWVLPSMTNSRDDEFAPVFARAFRVTSGPDLDFGPAISPDGKWVAYFSDAGGHVDLWVKFLSRGLAMNLTRESGLELPSRINIGGLAISPDGSELAFDAGAKAGTPSNLFDSWVIAAPFGGVPRKLVERGRAVRWSPQGTSIVYVRAGAAAGDSLYVADADGGNERQVVATRGGLHVHWPAWSSDGQYIYFVYTPSTANTEPSEIYRVAAAGGALQSVVTTARRALFPTPDGMGLLYAANPLTAETGLWWKSLRRSEQQPRPITIAVGEYADLSIARENGSVVATVLNVRQTLMRLAIGGGSDGTLRAITDGFTGDQDPSLSPQGDRLVFSSARDGSRSLWTTERDGSNPRPLTPGTSFDERPTFSPDGQRLAFVSDRGGKRGIWVMNADGGAARLVTHAQVLDDVSWSPDGRELVYATPVDEAPGLWVVTVDTGSIRALRTPGPAVSPVWSPRGDVIAYVEAKHPGQVQANSSRIAYVDHTGQPVHRTLPESLNVLNGFLAWSPDGRHIAAFVEPGASASAVWLLDTAGEEPARKVAQLPTAVRVRGATWSSDGSSLVLGYIERSSDIVVLER